MPNMRVWTFDEHCHRSAEQGYRRRADTNLFLLRTRQWEYFNLSKKSSTSGSADARDRWLILTGCRKGTVRQAIAAAAIAAGAWDAGLTELRTLVELFGRNIVAVELIDHGNPTDCETNDLLADLAAAAAPTCDPGPRCTGRTSRLIPAETVARIWPSHP